MRRLLLCAMLLFAVLPAQAIDSFPLPRNLELLERYRALSEEFRCLVCQNQNLADSNADLAVDLKKEIVGLLQAGKTDDEIRDFLVERYGDFVLYRPPVNSTTWLLWGGPAVLLILGGLLFLRRGRKVEALPETRGATDEALARLTGNSNQDKKA